MVKLKEKFNLTTLLLFKIIILLIYILIIPNKVPVVIIRKQGLNIKIVIKSFSL